MNILYLFKRTCSYIKSHLSKIPDNFIPISKRELFSYIDQIPVIEDSLTMAMMNEKGEITGSVTMLPDGRHILQATPKSDFSSVLLSIFLVFAEHVLPQDKVTFSRWAELPANEWTQVHRETFAVALFHYFLEVKKQGGELPPELVRVAAMFSESAVPSLRKAFTSEVRNVFRRLFV
jgi:hypothetical protein